MIPFTLQPLITIEPITPQKLAQGGAAVGQTPLWNGAGYTPQYPITALSNGALLGQVSEINVTGGASATISSGNRMNINVVSGQVNVNGTPVTGINTGTGLTASFAAGIATLNSSAMSLFRAEQVNSVGSVLYTNNIQNNFGLQFEAGNNITLTPSTLVNGTKIRIDAAAGTSYTHPTYPALVITPSLVGNTLNLHTIETNTIGSVIGSYPVALTLPSYSPTTLAHSGVGAQTFSGTAPAYTMKGLRSLSPSNLTISDNGTSLDFSFTPTGVQTLQNGTNTTAVSLGGGAWRIDVASFSSGVTSLNGATGPITLQSGSNMNIVPLGGGVFRFDSTASSILTGTSGNGLVVGTNSVSLALASVSSAGAMPILSGNAAQFLNGLGQWATPSGGGGGGVTSFNGAAGAVSLVDGLNSTVVSLGSGAFAVNVNIPSGGNSIAILDNGAFFMPAVTTLDIWNGTLQNLGGGLARLVLPTTGGGGITGIQINSAGNYQNIIFTGAGVYTAGNTVTINGGSGVSLIGYSGNGLTVGTDNVSLSLATVLSAGAMPALNGNINSYLAGNGSWQPVPTPSGGSVTSVSSGAPSVLSVSPTTGNVVITPTGTTTSFTPSLVGITLSLPNFTVTSGITTGIGTTFINLPSSGVNSLANGTNTTAVNLGGGVWRVDAASGLPTGTVNQTLRNWGSGWESTNAVRSFADGSVVLGNSSRVAIIDNNASLFFGEWFGSPTVRTFSVIFGNGPSSTFTAPRQNSFCLAGGDPLGITFEADLAQKKLGFFGAIPITRPNITPGNLASLENALKSLGLINF